MNQKELNEIRRRIAPNQCAINKLYGCYVNSNKEIIARLQESLGLMTEFESEKYLSLLKKVLSGSLGKNLIDIVFSTQQVVDSPEHKLLSTLRKTGLNDSFSREDFFQKVIDTLDMGESNYLILLAYDTYDVPYRSKDDDLQADASDRVFPYILCAVCPVKDQKPELAYYPRDNEFHTQGISQIVSPPELGFLFPAFDNRAANLYNALFYTKNDDQIHQEFIDAIFHTEPPMSAAEQKETFQSVLTDALEEACSYDVVQAVHEQLSARLVQHKERKDPEPLDLSSREIGAILRDSGVPEDRVQTFETQCAQQFGPDSALRPSNLIDSKRFQIETAQIKISVDPESSYQIETKIIGGRPYLLIPAGDNVEVNGIPISLPVREP